MYWIVPSVLLILTIAYFLHFRNQKKKDIELLSLKFNQAKLQAYQIESAKRQLENTLQEKILNHKLQFIENKNTFLRSVYERLAKLENPNNKNKNDLLTLVNMVESELNNRKAWKNFLQEFQQAHPHLHQKLIQKHKDLSFNDWRLIALSRYGFSTRDIASLLNISIEGVKKARYRLRKKLDIAAEKDLNQYFSEVE